VGKDTFAVLLLVGRPACGKSQIIESLKRVPSKVRRQRYHSADLDVLDDFPAIWSWLQEDDILERLGQPRLHTNPNGSIKHDYMWHVLIERLSLDYRERAQVHAHYHDGTTTIIEFSRGSVTGGYAQAFSHLADDLLRRAAVLYVQVSFEESLRRNRPRYRPERPGGTLEHTVPDEILRHCYADDGWTALTAADPEYLSVGDIRVPYVVLENEGCLDANRLDALALHLKDCLSALWDSYQGR